MLKSLLIIFASLPLLNSEIQKRRGQKFLSKQIVHSNFDMLNLTLSKNDLIFSSR